MVNRIRDFTLSPVAVGSILIAASVFASTAQAFTIGNRSYDANAAADAIGSPTQNNGGNLVYFGNSTNSFSEAVTGFDPNSYGTCSDNAQGASYASSPSGGTCGFDVYFTDNAVINGLGKDLTIFEVGGPETFYVTINGVTHTASSSTNVGGINAYDFDLSSFGLAANDTITSLNIGLKDWGYWNGADIAMIAAKNNVNVTAAVPTPPALALMALGLITMRQFRNRKA